MFTGAMRKRVIKVVMKVFYGLHEVCATLFECCYLPKALGFPIAEYHPTLGYGKVPCNG